MAKKNIHPVSHPLEIILEDKVLMVSSSSSLKRFVLERFYQEHPAWKKGGPVINQSSEDVSAFNKKYKNLPKELFGIVKKEK